MAPVVAAFALVVAILTIGAIRQNASRYLVTYAGLVSMAMAGLSVYLSYHELLGLRLWEY